MRICVFCGSSCGARPAYEAAAKQLGELLATRGIGVVFGGGCIGLMGAVADAALAHGGEVIGVIPGGLEQREIGHRGVTKLHVVETMHERKHRMAELADAFVALPGGIGTLEEVTEMLTWLQLGLHLKPVALLNACGYYNLFLQFLAHMRDEQFLTVQHHSMLSVFIDAESLLDHVTTNKHTWAPKPVAHSPTKVMWPTAGQRRG